MESAHFNSYRDHFIGQPILGDIDNIYNVTQDMVKKYHATHYVGSNLILVGTGNVNHKEFVDQVSRAFGNLNKNPPPGLEKRNMEKPIYTPSCMFMRDDEMYNSAVGVYYDAPHWHHEDYYAFLLMERICGSYQMDRNGQARLNDPEKQYSSLEAAVGQLPDVTKVETMYNPYRDCGLFGMYFFGNEVFTRTMTYYGILMPALFGVYMNQVEVYRGRAKLYQELLSIQSPSDVLQLIGPQMIYLNRRVTRTEIAKRVAFFDNNSLMKVMKHWCRDAEPSIVAYGAIESLAATGSYKFYKANSYITTLNLGHSLL